VPAPGKDRYSIAVLTRALDLLDALEVGASLSLTEASVRTGINKATAYRILANLEARGYVARDPATGRYRLGLRLAHLGMRMAEGLDLRTQARPLLHTLQGETAETVNLAVPGEAGIIYIDIVESERGLRMAATVGAQDDFHSTALGKAMLAYLPSGRLDQLLAGARLERKTPNTITRADRLRAELRRVRARGCAIDDEENEAGARCVAAPIFDHDSRVVGAVSVSGPASRLPAKRLPKLVEAVRAVSREISVRMGHRGVDGAKGAPRAG
jgi:IclR family acetate operon transcriptional repressor